MPRKRDEYEVPDVYPELEIVPSDIERCPLGHNHPQGVPCPDCAVIRQTILDKQVPEIPFWN